MNEDNFLEFLLKREKRKQRRPQMLPEPVPVYERDDSVIPERVRVSFDFMGENRAEPAYRMHRKTCGGCR